MKTKIICTIGPATKAERTLKRMVREGMDYARFNYSHGRYGEFREWAKIIRAEAKKVGRGVEIIQDLQGPRVRVGKLAHEGKHILAGHKVVLNFEHGAEPASGAIIIKNDVGLTLKKNDKVLLDKGLIELEVKKVEGEKAICKALTAGIIFSGKGVNLPNTETSKNFTDKDVKDLEEGLKMKVEWVALSFVENKADVEGLRSRIDGKTKIISKIERPMAIKNYREILDSSDAVMVARGDLGIEIPYWELPSIQKWAIKKAVGAGKLSIVATDMLASMVEAGRPSRAEILDIANAVMDGASAVMLSDETAVGKHPIESLIAMRKIAEEAERFSKGDGLKSLFN